MFPAFQGPWHGERLNKESNCQPCSQFSGTAVKDKGQLHDNRMTWLNSIRLNSKSAGVRRRAIEALADEAGDDTLDMLLAGLNDEAAEVRSAAARVLGDRREARSVSQLILTLRDPESEVREAVATALGCLGNPQAIPPLIQTLRELNNGVRACAAAALDELGWRPKTQEEQALLDMASGNVLSAARAGEAAVESLVKELKHDTSFQRRAAAEALEGTDDPRAIQPLLSALDDADVTVQVSAIHALGRVNSEPVCNALLQKLRASTPQVRLAAAQVIGRWQDPATAEAFVDALADSNFEVRVTAIQYFERLSDPRAAEVIVPLLSDPDSDVRQASAKALGVLRNAMAIPGLVMTLIDEERLVRRTAEESLKQIDLHWPLTEGALSMLPQLESALQHHTPWVGQAASQALTLIQGAFAATLGAGPDAAEGETKLLVR